jgi:hypothetical protein
VIEDSDGCEDMTYSPGGSQWLVVSGYRGGDIFYEKFLIGDDLIRGFSMQYPMAARDFYDPIVEKMEDSFGILRAN